jgi:hypothetical protein
VFTPDPKPFAFHHHPRRSCYSDPAVLLAVFADSRSPAAGSRLRLNSLMTFWT